MSDAFWVAFFGLLAFFSVGLMCVIARRAFDRLERNGFEDYDLREAANAEREETRS